MRSGYGCDTKAWSIAVVGLGNIGSQVIPLLAGLPCLSRVILIDHDRYGAANLGHQRISKRDIGEHKVKVQARVLHAFAAGITVDTFACAIEAVPLGKLRDCMLLACVDSRKSRQSINRIAFRLAIPWIDAGLDRAGSVRTRVFQADSADSDCLECSWSERDYELLEQAIPCSDDSSSVAPTQAPPELGAVVAGMQVSLLRSLLLAKSAEVLDGLARKQWFLDLPSGRGWVGRYARNLSCRFDHSPWKVERLWCDPRNVTLRETFGLAGLNDRDAELSLEGQHVVHRLRCISCGSVRRVRAHLSGRIAARECCGAMMRPAAIDVSHSLNLRDLHPSRHDRRLSTFGFVDGDVISMRAAEIDVHYQLNATRVEAA